MKRKKTWTAILAWAMGMAAAWASGETFVSPVFRLDLRMEGGVRAAEPAEIVQTSAAWQESLVAGDCVAEVSHRAPGAEEAEVLHRTTSPGTESFVWDALHAIPGDHAFTHTVKNGGTVVETMSMTYRVPEPRLEAIRIFGPASFASGNSAQYVCMGYFSDGAGREVPATWSLPGGEAGIAVAVDGTLSAEQSTSDRTILLHAVSEVDGTGATNELAVTVAAAKLKLLQTAMNVDEKANAWSVPLSSTGPWTAESSAGWLTLIEAGGTGDGLLAFQVETNPEATYRKATITVSCGILTAKLSVKQDPGQPAVTVTVAFDARGGTADYATHDYLSGEPYGTLPKATLAGKVFGGWWTQPDGQGTRIIYTTEVSADITTLYAYWRDMTVADALDDELAWTDGGDKPWVIDTATHASGDSSMRSGAIGDNGTSTIMVEVDGPGTVAFWWKASCEEDYDQLLLFDGGSTNRADAVAAISGQTKWKHATYDVGGGTHLLRWVYAKDRVGGEGRDCAWLDGVVWMPGGIGQDTNDAARAWFGEYGLDYATTAALDTDGDGLTNMEEFLVGSNPTNPDSAFRINLLWEDGEATVVPDPYLGNLREYTIEGKTSMDEVEWTVPANATHRFFRATVKTKPAGN